METWPHLTIQVNDTRIPITGNGFSATGRLELLTLLYAYVERLGVRIEFEHDIASLDEVQDADLIVGANGAFSWVRTENEDQFGTHHRLAAEPLYLVRAPARCSTACH
jgi:2-polyprenyl-6-methoxyphenol hydroxylase-like FAD-dependent oxidoreductase